MLNARNGPKLAIAASAALLGVIVIGAIVLFASRSGGGSDAPDALPEPNATLVAANRTPRLTTVSLLASGPDRAKIDSKVFDLIAAGITWRQIGDDVFPGSEVDVVMIYPDRQATSVGLMTREADPAAVEALWRELGQPDRKRPLYLASVGDDRNLQVEKWLREKVAALGFQLVGDRSKARETLFFTVAR